jgi:hypothetical protein
MKHKKVCANVLLNVIGDGREIPQTSVAGTDFYRSEWFEGAGGSRRFCCILWVPREMNLKEAVRIVFPEGVSMRGLPPQ